jgi:hypothetical protein
MSQEALLLELASRLDSAQIPFMIAGSHGSSLYGQPRATNDVDIVIDPSSERLEEFVRDLGSRYYVSVEAARDALTRRSMFNVIDFSTGTRADLIVRKNRPFSMEEFHRRTPQKIGGREIPVASPEDIILSKLEWDKITPSDRQVQDAFHVVMAQGPSLDVDYLRKWATSLGVSEKLEELLAKAGELQRRDPP